MSAPSHPRTDRHTSASLAVQDTGTTTPRRRGGRTRPHLAQLGLNPLGQLLLALNALVLVADVAVFHVTGLSIQWSTAIWGPIILAGMFALWLNFWLTPGNEKEWFLAEVVFLMFALVLLTNLTAPFQYAAVALRFPYADPWLAAADSKMGVSVPSLAAWTWAHPRTNTLLGIAYGSLLPQCFIVVIAIAAVRDRDALWEFTFNAFFCILATVAALVIWPALGPAAYFHFRPTVDMTRLVAQVRALHDGTFTLVRFDQLEGLVSFPSLHVAGALALAWAVRRHRVLLVPMLLLNALLIVSTVWCGVHYLVDVIAGVPVFAGSALLYRWRGRGLLVWASAQS